MFKIIKFKKFFENSLVIKIVADKIPQEKLMEKEKGRISTFDSLDYDIKYDLMKYTTLRIDLKNFGLDNDLEILEISDENITLKRPDWLSNEEGKGLILQSYKGLINLKVKCINKGVLRITLRGIDFRDSKRDRFPVYVNISNLKINEEEIIENRLVWHSEPYIFKKEVGDSEIIDLDIKWSPINRESIFKNTLKLKNDELNSNVSKLKKELNLSNKKIITLSKECEKFKDENYDLRISLERLARENYDLKNKLKKNNNFHRVF